MFGLEFTISSTREQKQISKPDTRVQIWADNFDTWSWLNSYDKEIMLKAPDVQLSLYTRPDYCKSQQQLSFW